MSEELKVKRPIGRPRKNLEMAPPKGEPKKFKMRAKPNWETVDPNSDNTPDRLRINPDLIPEGMSAVWVTDSVLGQSFAQHRSDFERKGWTPVHGDDFDGQFDGMFNPKGTTGEINNGGLVLMMRPKEMTEAAARRDYRAAREQVNIKENALRGGDINTSLDSQHPSALSINTIKKTVERLDIPKD